MAVTSSRIDNYTVRGKMVIQHLHRGYAMTDVFVAAGFFMVTKRITGSVFSTSIFYPRSRLTTVIVIVVVVIVKEHCDSLGADWNFSVPPASISIIKNKKWKKKVKNEKGIRSTGGFIDCTGTLERASALTWPHSCSLPFPVCVNCDNSDSRSCLPKELSDLVIEYHEDFTLHFASTLEDSNIFTILSISPGFSTKL